MNIEDLIIIGGGPGGLNAALYALRSGLKLKLIEGFLPGGQMNNTLSIDNYLGLPNVNGGDLGQEMLSHVLKFTDEENIIYENAEKVENIDSKYFKVTLSSGKEILSKSVILATGCTHRKLNIKNESELEGRGVSYCATCDGAFFKNKRVVVVGGGNTAVEDALYLSGIAKEVIVIHRRNKLRAEDVLTKQAFEKENIDFIWDSEVKEIIGEKQVEEIIIKNKIDNKEVSISLDGLFIAVGLVPVKPELSIDSINSIISSDGFIKTNENMSTDIPGLYAIGDIRDKDLRQVITAISDGAIAAKEILNYISN